ASQLPPKGKAIDGSDDRVTEVFDEINNGLGVSAKLLRSHGLELGGFADVWAGNESFVPRTREDDARTAGFLPASSKAAITSPSVLPFKALSTFGRFWVT